MESKTLKTILALLMAAVMVLAMAACGNSGKEEAPAEPEKQEEEAPASDSAELTEEQIEALMWQVADKEVERQYVDYLPDEGFANAEIFGIDRDGDEGTAYVNIFTGEYVVFEEKAYNMSASAGEAIIKFKYTDDQPEFTELVWSADGGEHDKWLEENFPEEYLKKAKEYQANDEDGRNVLGTAQAKDVEEEMKAPVDPENMLMIDLDNGVYALQKFDDSGNAELIKSGSINDLKK